MSAVVLGVDLGTSAVKVLAVDKAGTVVAQQSVGYELQQPQPGYSEQRPEDWVTSTTAAIQRLISEDHLKPEDIQGISYSGQMHGLVLLDANHQVLRPAILWNDTRTTPQCHEIERVMGDQFVEITGNRPLEGFTLPKLLWVKENEPEIWVQTDCFVLPKDYVRYRMTGQLAMDYSDATGTVLLDVKTGKWSKTICEQLGVPERICPPLMKSVDFAGNVTPKYAQQTGLTITTKVYGGAADNAAGAVGAGILSEDKVMASIGTSGVVLKYEDNPNTNYHGVLQFEDHAFPDKYYSMGVTLAAGYSLSWFKKTFAPDVDFTEMVASAAKSTVGANGLIFTPYIVGERAPYADADIRGSFIGIDGTHQRYDFVRAVLEGIIFSFKDLMQIYEEHGSQFKTVVAIGGGAKSPLWLQIQADIFNHPVVSLQNEQGPGMGAAMIAATGLGWFDSMEDCAQTFVHYGKVYEPIAENVTAYQQIDQVYHQAYSQTKGMTAALMAYRRAE